jgi:hypothetical protein
VGTVVAIDENCLAVVLKGGIVDGSHAGILPRVLDGIGEDDVRALNVQGTIVSVGSVDVGFRILSAEDVSTERSPILRSDELGSHGMLRVGDLEPAELCANLPGPLSLVLVDVIGDVLEKGSVIALEVSHAHLVSNLLDNWELSDNRACVNTV